MEQNKDLDTLLSKDELLTLPEVADELGIAVTRVHDLLHDKKLIAHTRGTSHLVGMITCPVAGLRRQGRTRDAANDQTHKDHRHQQDPANP